MAGKFPPTTTTATSTTTTTTATSTMTTTTPTMTMTTSGRDAAHFTQGYIHQQVAAALARERRRQTAAAAVSGNSTPILSSNGSPGRVVPSSNGNPGGNSAAGIGNGPGASNPIGNYRLANVNHLPNYTIVQEQGVMRVRFHAGPNGSMNFALNPQQAGGPIYTQPQTTAATTATSSISNSQAVPTTMTPAGNFVVRVTGTISRPAASTSSTSPNTRGRSSRELHDLLAAQIRHLPPSNQPPSRGQQQNNNQPAQQVPSQPVVLPTSAIRRRNNPVSPSGRVTISSVRHIPYSSASTSTSTPTSTWGSTVGTSFPGAAAATAVVTTTPPPPPRVVLPMPRLLPPPFPPTAAPCTPPNWTAHHDSTLCCLSPFKLFPVNEKTAEYKVLADLLHPVKISGVDQVVNADLWDRFVSARKDMLRAKCDDLILLKGLGLDETQVVRIAQMSFNYDRDEAVADSRYTDNMALLFHCTRNAGGIDAILTQGLDERVSNQNGGLLGRGIYFADNPQKSINYDGGSGVILVFAVLLGDCLSMDQFQNKKALVREPEKVDVQKRNFKDQFFDSIVARPGADNEYVIYNRYQCCPIYKIKYQRGVVLPANPNNSNDLPAFRQHRPPIAWAAPSTGVGPALPPPTSRQGWPFLASYIFSQMGVQPQEDGLDSAMADGVVPSIPSPVNDDSIAEKLQTLANLGFFDVEENLKTLKKFKYNMDQCVNHLLDQPTPMVLGESVTPVMKKSIPVIDIDMYSDGPMDTSGPCTSAQAIARDAKKSNPTRLDDTLPVGILNGDHNNAFLADPVPDIRSTTTKKSIPSSTITSEVSSTTPTTSERTDCPICYEDFPDYSPSQWVELKCGHKMCTTCHGKIKVTRTTMSGTIHTCVICPFCQSITGIRIGDCPDGTMTVTTSAGRCEGYEQVGAMMIDYRVSDPRHPRLHRVAYFPDTSEGREIVELLRKAWDRRLVFTVGTSNTSGQQNVLVWNIHHKTSNRGGPQQYGYPDPGYFDRVKAELKAFGIQ